jgi:hypothetical protein
MCRCAEDQAPGEPCRRPTEQRTASYGRLRRIAVTTTDRGRHTRTQGLPVKDSSEEPSTCRRLTVAMTNDGRVSLGSLLGSPSRTACSRGAGIPVVWTSTCTSLCGHRGRIPWLSPLRRHPARTAPRTEVVIGSSASQLTLSTAKPKLGPRLRISRARWDAPVRNGRLPNSASDCGPFHIQRQSSSASRSSGKTNDSPSPRSGGFCLQIRLSPRRQRQMKGIGLVYR